MLRGASRSLPLRPGTRRLCLPPSLVRHVDALAAIAKEGVASAAVLFVCARGDCSSFRPHAARCPSFAAHLKEAKKAGVTLVARKIRWDVRDGVAHAFDDGAIPVDV